jgi:hypothetical protein
MPDVRAEDATLRSPRCPYSPKVVEEKFCEVEVDKARGILDSPRQLATMLP